MGFSDILARQWTQLHYCIIGDLRKSSCILGPSVQGGGQNRRITSIIRDYLEEPKHKRG